MAALLRARNPHGLNVRCGSCARCARPSTRSLRFFKPPRGNPTTLFADQFKLIYKYDLNSNLTEVKPLIGPATFYEYDALDRVKKMTDPLGGISLFSYDTLDQLTTITDPRAKITTSSTDGPRLSITS